MVVAKPLELFLKPDSVAVIGASRRTGRGSFNIVENLLELGYRGQIYPVNPIADTILGLKVYNSVKALPQDVDLGVVMTARETVPKIVSDSADRGIQAFIIITEGFAEADEKGKELQSEIAEIAKKKGARIIGPNSLGIVNGIYRFSSSFTLSSLKTEPVAFICQSGGFLEGFSGFTFGKGIDLGNMCDIDFIDALKYFEHDPETKVIALHIEGLKEGRKFLHVARQVRRKKPVLVLKTGRSESGTRTAASHTGSLTGRDEVYRAAFRQAGLIQVSNVDELGDIARAFLDLPLPKGNRVAIITPSGAAAAMSLDAMEDYGFEPAKLMPETVNSIRGFFPVWSQPVNPVDVMAAGVRHGYKKVYRSSLNATLEDNNVDAILCIAGFPTLKTIRAATSGMSKPVVAWVLGEWGENLLSTLRETGYRAVYSSPERAFRALAALRYYSDKRSVS
jgi:acetyltransferase